MSPLSHLRVLAVRLTGFCLWISPVAMAAGASQSPSKPNIVFVLTEDWSLDLGCYGNHELKTPAIDAFAKEGRLYRMAFCTAPVCSPSRSAIMTGFDQHTIGAQHHRTEKKKPLPAGILPVPELLARAGYFTCNPGRKTDCNFTTEKPLFMGKDWSGRAPGQPFFAQYTLAVSHRPFTRDKRSPIDPAKITLPPYYPDTPLVRRDWADGLESMQIADRQFGDILARLKKEGLENDTLVVFIADNGLCHARGKQFLYEAGIHIPMIVRWPGHVKAGEESTDLVSSIDISATFLAVAGVVPQRAPQGLDLFDGSTAKRDAVFAGSDLMDETHDAARVIRTRRFALIRNLMPERPWVQRNRYKENEYPAWATLNLFHLQGKLTPAQERFMAPKKPEYELYDMQADPHQLRNLADDPAFTSVRTELASRLDTWRRETGDPGVDAAYRADGEAAPIADPAFWEAKLKRFEAKSANAR